MSLQIEFRQLASFVLVCQNPTISESAKKLGVSVSTLSARLHSLERNLELSLFERNGRFLRLLPAAIWLFQHATALLHLESFACSTVVRLSEPKNSVRVRLSLDFTMGRFSRAVSRTIEAIGKIAPGTHFTFEFLDGDPHGLPSPSPSVNLIPSNAETEICIGYFETTSDALTVPLVEDRWVALSLVEGNEDFADPLRPLVVMRMQKTLRDAISAYAYRHNLSNRLTFVDEVPVELAEGPARMPEAVFLMPQSMLGDRLGRDLKQVKMLEPELSSQISARIIGPNQVQARTFLIGLKKELEGPAVNAVFTPILTARQIRYFNITLQASGISAAARSAHLTQPTISLQIQKMEAALGCILLERSSSGVEITSAGRLLAPLASEIEALLNAILSNRRSVAAFTQSAVAIGFLPSSGHDSAMTAQFADALTLLRRNHPECRLTLVEDTNAALHEAIGSGELNLAVVGSVEGSFARVMLGKSEHLSVVANPALGLAGRPNIALSEACALPLVLGPQFLTIHAAFANAAAERRLHINQVIEAGSIPLAISMTRRAPLCTVLPASSVRNDVAAGRLTVTPIAERLSIGNLAVIFSGERELSEIERAAVRALATAF